MFFFKKIFFSKKINKFCKIYSKLVVVKSQWPKVDLEIEMKLHGSSKIDRKPEFKFEWNENYKEKVKPYFFKLK